MNVGDLVRVKYDGTVGIVARVEHPEYMVKAVDDEWRAWVTLHTGEEFRAHKLEVINESR